MYILHTNLLRNGLPRESQLIVCRRNYTLDIAACPRTTNPTMYAMATTWLLYSKTAASRRSLVRVSVPVWGINLSVPLDIVAMVSRYLSI